MSCQLIAGYYIVSSSTEIMAIDYFQPCNFISYKVLETINGKDPKEQRHE
jgi:hypothetical protein